MKKNNQSGFMLAEAFIVSAFILGVLVFMFVQINTVISGYNKSFSYNTIPGIYITREIKKFITDNNYQAIKENVELNGYAIIDASYLTEVGNDMIKDSEVKTIIVSKQDMTILKNSTDEKISSKLLSFIDTLNSNSHFDYLLIVEFTDDTYSTINI